MTIAAEMLGQDEFGKALKLFGGVYPCLRLGQGLAVDVGGID